nr:hemicentin 1 [Hymenolepis microstoma]
MQKTNLNILRFQWALSALAIFAQSHNERLTASDDSITGFFLEKDLSPTLPKHAPEKFINITVEEGATELTLQCNEEGRRVAWYKDGLKLRPSLRFQINSTGSLRIIGVNKDHIGVYHCFVNVLNEAKLLRSYSIQVAYRPVVLSHFAKSVFLTSGQPGHIVCCLSGFPEVSEVMWHQRVLTSAVKIPEQRENSTIHTKSISGQPFSNLVHQEQDGRVTIEEMANEVGIAHESAFSLLTGNLGLRASSPWARWIPNALQKQHLTQRTQLSLPNLAMMEANEDNFLSDVNCYKKSISYVIPELAGAYTCQGKNALGWGQRSTPFDVFVQVRPYFTQKPDKHPDRRVFFLEILRSCKAEGFPPPEIAWAKFTLKVTDESP